MPPRWQDDFNATSSGLSLGDRFSGESFGSLRRACCRRCRRQGRKRQPRSVLFPKYVTINNPRLAILYLLLWAILVFVGLYQFVSTQRYNIEKIPQGAAAFCTQLCQPTPQALAANMQKDMGRPFCTSGHPSYWTDDTRRFDVGGCANLCGSSNATLGDPCLHRGEVVQMGLTSAFVPTFFVEEAMATCSAPSNGLCSQTSSYFIAGIEQTSIEFVHRYTVARPTSQIFGSPPDLTGKSSEDLGTVVLGRDGSTYKRFRPGERIRFTVAEILEAASIDEAGAEDRNRARLDLDEPYVRSDEMVSENKNPSQSSAHGPSLRLTGFSVMFDLYFTNSRSCRLNINTDPQDADSDYIACLSIRANRLWTSSEQIDVVSEEFHTRRRTYHGILFKFNVQGSFKFLDMGMLLWGITSVIILGQTPIFIVYWFSILFLGNLSTIYSRVLHQNLSLADACKGLASRLIAHSAAFMDVQDTKVGDGVSKPRLLHRFNVIMRDMKELDSREVKKFVDFVFSGLRRMDTTHDRHCIHVQSYCSACSSNEPLSFDSLVKIFDKDRRLGVLERCFIDDTIRQVHKAALNENAFTELGRQHGSCSSAMGEAEVVQQFPLSSHSQLHKALSTICSMQQDMSSLHKNVDTTCRDVQEALRTYVQLEREVGELRDQVRSQGVNED